MSLVYVEDIRRCNSFDQDLTEYTNGNDNEELYVITRPKTTETIKSIITIKFTTLKIVQIAPNFLCIYKKEVGNPQEFFERRVIQLFANG